MQAQRRFSLPVTGVAGPDLMAKLGTSGLSSAGNSAVLKKTVLAGMAIGALFVIAKKMRKR